MPRSNSSSSSSDSSGGGAPLHSTTPESGSPHRGQDANRSTDPTTDDENQLLNASNAFAEQIDPSDPTVTQPTYPQSVPPSTYRYWGSGVPMPRETIQPQNNSTQAVTRYRQSFSSNDSSRSSGYPSGLPAISNNADSLQLSSVVHSRLMMAGQFLHNIAGVTDRNAQIHQQMMQEISQLVNSMTMNLRQQIDNAARELTEEREKAKRVLYDERLTRDQRDKAEADLKLAVEKEAHARDELRIYKERNESLKAELATVVEDSKRFQLHHGKTTKEWDAQDERNWKQIHALEAEIKRLRFRNAQLARMTGEQSEVAFIESGEFPSPSVPDSFINNSIREASRDKSSGGLVKPLPPPDGSARPPLPPDVAADLMARLKASINIKDEDIQKRPSVFRPNPKAAAWSPAVSKVGEVTQPTTTTSAATLDTLKAVAPPTNESPQKAPPGDRNRGRQSFSSGILRARESSTPAKKGLPHWSSHGHRTSFQTPMPSAGAHMRPFTPGFLTYRPGTAGPSGQPFNQPQTPKTPKTPKTPGDNAGESKAATKYTTIARDKEYWEVDDIQQGFDYLYGLIKGYVVSCHGRNEPPTVPNEKLEYDEPATWFYMTKLVYLNAKQASNHLRYLINTPAFRPYIIMRIALDYLFKKMVSPDVYLGFSAELDGHLGALQEKISAFGKGNFRGDVRERQRVIDEHARLIYHALKYPGMSEFRATTIDYHAKMLSEILRPLRSRSVTDEEVLKSLRIMVSVTWDISSKIWITGMTVHYTFPECGYKFASDTMDAINGSRFEQEGNLLHQDQLRISFVMSPVLTLRDERADGRVRAHNLRKAEIIAMKSLFGNLGHRSFHLVTVRLFVFAALVILRYDGFQG
ncbi:hypothetical protein F5B20DRAFT_576961 [Whalleya microplaca]|nr:hypothetical protein F5B20DRAFT_576961 [Whalleya microplaca]